MYDKLLKSAYMISRLLHHQLGLPTVPEWPVLSWNWPTVSRARLILSRKIDHGHGYMAVH